MGEAQRNGGEPTTLRRYILRRDSTDVRGRGNGVLEEATHMLGMLGAHNVVVDELLAKWQLVVRTMREAESLRDAISGEEMARKARHGQDSVGQSGGLVALVERMTVDVDSDMWELRTKRMQVLSLIRAGREERGDGWCSVTDAEDGGTDRYGKEDAE